MESIGSTLLEGLVITLVGLGVVFLGLCIIILCISAMRLLRGGRKAEKAEKPAAPLAVIPPPAEETPASAPDQSELLAVIAAAVACILEGENRGEGAGFTVRRVRHISGGSGWKSAAHTEQIYSRM